LRYYPLLKTTDEPVLPLQKKSQGLKSKLRKQNDIGLEKLKQNIRKLIKEIPKTTYKKLFQGSYNRTKKYKPKKTRAKTLKIYK
jgi:hypothetical protein